MAQLKSTVVQGSLSVTDTIYTNGKSIVDLIYPIGSIYMSVNNVNPQTIFGGTWEQIEDTFLLAAGQTYAAGATGGEAEHELIMEEIPAHRHNPYGSNEHDRGDWCFATIRDISSRSGKMSMSSGSDYYGFASNNTWNDIQLRKNTAPSGGRLTLDENGHVTAHTTIPHNNMPPYLAVYVWKRTA